MLVTTHAEPANQAVSITVHMPTFGHTLTLRSDCLSRPVDRRWDLAGLHPGEQVEVGIADRRLPAIADAGGLTTVTWDGHDAAGRYIDSAVASVEASSGSHRMRLGRWDSRQVGLGGFLLGGYDYLDVVGRRIRTGWGRLIGGVAIDRDDVGYRVGRQNGRSITLFDANGFPYRIADATGTSIASWTRDAAGLTGQFSHAGNITVFRTNGAIVMERHGRRIVLDCDELGHVSAVRDSAGNTLQVEWDARGMLVGIIEPTGFAHGYDYDDAGRLIMVRRPGCGPTRFQRTAIEHGHRVTVLTSQLRETSYSFEKLPDGTRIRTRKCCGRPPEITRIIGSRVDVERGDGVRIINDRGTGERQVVLPSGLTNSRVVRGDEISINGRVWQRTSNEHESVTITPEGRITRAHFRDGGIDIAAPSGASRVDYDESSGAVTRRAPAETMTLHSNELGLLSRVDYDDGRQVAFDYDQTGWLRAQHMPDGRTLTLDRAADGAVCAITPPGRGATAFDFDAPARLAAIRFAGSADDAIAYSYDGDGLLVGRAVGAGRLTTRRDSDGLVCEIVGERPLVHVEYHCGRPVRVTTGEGAQATEFGWDGPLLTSTTGIGVAQGRVVRSYDPDFLVAGLRCGDLAATVTRDRDGLITGLGPAVITRDHAGDVGVIAAGQVAQRWQRDEQHRTVAMTLEIAGRPTWQVSYRYDARNRIVGLTDSQMPMPQEAAFGYDDAGRLISAGGSLPLHAEWDENSNLTGLIRGGESGEIGSTFAYAPADCLIGTDQRPAEHDDAGRLVRRPRPDRDSDDHLEYDELGQLVGITTGERSVRLWRDGLSNVVGIETDGVMRHRLIPGPNGYPDATVADDGRPRALYIGYAPDMPPALAIEPSRVLFLAVDRLGSLRFAVDIATGQVVEQRTYDHSGTLRARDGDAGIPFGWGGGLADGVTDIAHFPARSYDPRALRFTTRDPLLFTTGATNLYTFAGGDPINYRDPSGMQQVQVCRQATDVGKPVVKDPEHWWIKQGDTETGMGGAPEGSGNFLNDIVGNSRVNPKVAERDHGNRSQQPGVTCDDVENVNERCVADAIQTGEKGVGDFLGNYGPLGNNCQSWVDEVLSRCSGGDYVIRTDDPEAYDKYYTPIDADQTVPKDSPRQETPWKNYSDPSGRGSGGDAGRGGSGSDSDGGSDGGDSNEWRRHGANAIGPLWD